METETRSMKKRSVGKRREIIERIFAGRGVVERSETHEGHSR